MEIYVVLMVIVAIGLIVVTHPTSPVTKRLQQVKYDFWANPYRVKCNTCDRWLVDKFFVDGVGELPRPHHLLGEECGKEDPDWSTEN